MDPVTAIITLVVAVVGASGTFYATVSSNRKTRRENEEQHGASKEALAELVGVVSQMNGTVLNVDSKVDWIGERVAVVERTVGIDAMPPVIVVHNHQKDDTHAYGTQADDGQAHSGGSASGEER